jgi:hypothetical protein
LPLLLAEAFLFLCLAKLGIEKGNAIRTNRIRAKRKNLGDPDLEFIGRNLS